MNYVTVFDASQEPFRNLGFVVPGIILMVVGAAMVLRSRASEGVGFRGWSFFFLAVAWTIISVGAIGSQALEASRRVQSGDCFLVEGAVENFHPAPRGGHGNESFDVHGVPFSYSDFAVTAGFNRTASHGGPIRPGLPVRICYHGGNILRLEVAR